MSAERSICSPLNMVSQGIDDQLDVISEKCCLSSQRHECQIEDGSHSFVLSLQILTVICVPVGCLIFVNVQWHSCVACARSPIAMPILQKCGVLNNNEMK